jgi:hypothetical protein
VSLEKAFIILLKQPSLIDITFTSPVSAETGANPIKKG